MLHLYINFYENGTHQMDCFKEDEKDIVGFEEAKECHIGEDVVVHHNKPNGKVVFDAILTDVGKDGEGIWFAAYVKK